MQLKPILLALKHNKIMTVLMVLQIAMTVTVLSVSVLVAATTLAQWNMPSGLPHANIIRIGAEFYDDTQDVGAAMHRDLQRIQSVAGVLDVARTNAVPFGAEGLSDVYLSADEQAEPHRSMVFETDSNILNTLQLDVVEGRGFELADEVIAEQEQQQSAAVVMLSEDMAKQLFGDETAVGKTVWLQKTGDPAQIVGVYSNFMVGEWLNALGKSYHSIIRPQVLHGHNREPEYLIRVEPGKGEALIEDLVNTLYAEQGRYIFASELLKRVQKRMYDGRGSRAATELVISLTLTLITAAGIAGLTSFQVNQRRKQIGTRRALGARKSDIVRYFLTENAIISLMGLVIGMLATVYLTYKLSIRDEENYLDIGIMLIIAVCMWLTSALATWLPARNATRISPAIVTRG